MLNKDVKVKESHIGEMINIAMTYKNLSYFSYYQLILW